MVSPLVGEAMGMKIELRWFKSVDDGDYKLQYRDAYYEYWEEVPFVLEGTEERTTAALYDGDLIDCDHCGKRHPPSESYSFCKD